MLNPLPFVKSVTIVERATAPEILRTHSALNVADFIGAIPYVNDWNSLFTVDPVSKFRQTIVQGDGDCSNLVFGAAYALDRAGIDYEIIHLLPRTTVLDGEGHVVLRVPYSFEGAQRIGIVDVQAAGLPQSQGRFVDRKDLENGPLPEYTLLRLNPGRDHSNSPYYTDFLATARVGSMSSTEVGRYFRFIESVYVPLGNAPFEKYLFDGAAVLLGIFPPIYVTSPADLFQDVHLLRHFFIFALWMMRSLPLFIPLFVLSEMMVSRQTGIPELERETGFEPATDGLGSRCATTALLPPLK